MAVRTSPLKNLFHRISYFGFLGFRAAVGAIPQRLAFALGDVMALAWWHADRRHRELALANIRIAFPDWQAGKRRRLVFNNYRHLTRLLVETFRFGYYPIERWDEFLSLDNTHLFEALHARGKGTIAITGHLGNFELLQAHTIKYGQVYLVARRIHNPYLDDAIRARRESSGGVQIYPTRESPRHILKALRKKGTVCFVVDQSAKGEEGVTVPFFGHPAPTHSGPALIALRTGAPVFSITAFRDKRGRIRVRYGKEIELVRTGDLRRDIETNTARFNEVIEDLVREEPQQWFWVHDRWRLKRQLQRKRRR